MESMVDGPPSIEGSCSVCSGSLRVRYDHNPSDSRNGSRVPSFPGDRISGVIAFAFTSAIRKVRRVLTALRCHTALLCSAYLWNPYPVKGVSQ